MKARIVRSIRRFAGALLIVGAACARSGPLEISDVQLEAEGPGACYHTFAGTNPRACTPGGATGFTCALRVGNTAACSGGTAFEGVVVSDDGTVSGWNQDVVSMC